MRWNLRTRSMLSLLFAGLMAAVVTGCKKKYPTESYQPAPPAESATPTNS